MSALNLWVKAFAFDAGIQSGELPVYAFLGLVSPLFPRLCFLGERLHVWEPSIQAWHRQDAERARSALEPTPVLGGMVDLQPCGQRASLFWRESFIAGAHPMGSEVLTPQTHPRGFWGADFQQGADRMGPVPSGPVLCDLDMPRAIERLREQAEVRRPMCSCGMPHIVRSCGLNAFFAAPV
jgi:hypothetical protein